LPGRPNIVISRNHQFKADGAAVYPSLQTALAACRTEPVVCIIGGAQVFGHSLNLADRIIATEVHSTIKGNVFFPALDASQWREIERLPQPTENGYDFDFVVYQRRRAA
ncbi:MAG: dihydrofolate reductase, partial [Burkholderiaceae bacterium]